MAPPDPTTIPPPPPAPSPAQTEGIDGAAASGSRLSTEALILLFFGTIAALYLGRDVFIPLALAILMSFALGPLVTRLYRLGLGRVPAVLVVITLVTLLLGGFAAMVASQLVHLAEELPRYESNLRAKAKLFSGGMPGSSLIDHAADVLRDMGQEIEQAAQGNPSGWSGTQPGQQPPPGQQGRPIPVEIHQPPSSPLEALSSVAEPLLGPIATVGVVIVFVIFVLLQREDLRDRLIRLFGLGDVHRTTEAVNDAAKRVGRYLIMQLVINLAYGVLVGTGLFFIGVPNALLWGMLGTILRFIPYLGPFLATLLPTALALAVDPGWSTVLLTIGLFVAIELITNNLLEPWLYGSSTGLSPLAIIVAAVFWTTLWGPVGLLLSTPLTVCLVVLGRHVPQLQFLEVLLGSAPVLTPEVKFYQRLLADDPHEAGELAEDLLDQQPLQEVLDGMILPALTLAEQDRSRGAFDRARSRVLAGIAIDIVDRLAEAVAEERAPIAQRQPPLRVLCVGARNGLDRAGAVMLAHLLRLKGVDADAITAEPGLPPRTELATYDAVCLSFTDPRAWRQARRLTLRLRARQGGQRKPVWLGLWTLPPGEIVAATTATGADGVVSSLAAAVAALAEAEEAEVQPPPAEAAVAGPGAGPPAARLDQPAVSPSP
ncbi:AI-2E family transporter [Benzoatithermus flavus]|uniref:AI-2E family transporter n=1 Tax=Benzoatithermus flavus TaxID=3108223 RepID=A0ABU8XYI6_9PROT